MKQLVSVFLLIPLLFLYSCGRGQSENVLSPEDFKTQMAASEGAVVLDVRTPEEFSQGHLEHAVNVDWNSADFDKRIAKMDKSSTYFVYCLSGGRSGSAAADMRAKGFTNVIEMEGGMMAWRAAKLPEVMGNTPRKTGMTYEAFLQKVNSDKTVLVDFYAEWCGPCKKMEPSLNSLSKEMEATVEVIRIDVDQSPELAAKMGVTALPTLHIYKQGKLTWQNVGYLEKEQLIEAVKK